MRGSLAIAHSQLADGFDPVEAKRLKRREAEHSAKTIFGRVAGEYIGKMARAGKSAATLKARWWFVPLLGGIPTQPSARKPAVRRGRCG